MCEQDYGTVVIVVPFDVPGLLCLHSIESDTEGQDASHIYRLVGRFFGPWAVLFFVERFVPTGFLGV